MKFQVEEVSDVEERAGPCETEGVYVAELTSVRDAVAASGKDMVKFVLTIDKGDHKGEVIFTQVLIPNTGDEKLDRIFTDRWMRLLCSSGLKQKQAKSLLMKGFDTSKLRGKKATVFFKPKDEAAGRRFGDVFWRMPNRAPAAPVIEEDTSPQGDALDAFLGGDDVDEDIPF